MGFQSKTPAPYVDVSREVRKLLKKRAKQQAKVRKVKKR